MSGPMPMAASAQRAGRAGRAGRLGAAGRAVGIACLLAATMATTAAALELQAHRGGRGLWPENTLHAFGEAVALGVDTLELDVVLTADDAVVVSHDTALNPAHTRDATGAWLAEAGPRIRALALDRLQRHDVGRIRPGTELAAQFPDQATRDGEHVPTLPLILKIARALKCSSAHLMTLTEAKLAESAPSSD